MKQKLFFTKVLELEPKITAGESWCDKCEKDSDELLKVEITRANSKPWIGFICPSCLAKYVTLGQIVVEGEPEKEEEPKRKRRGENDTRK